MHHRGGVSNSATISLSAERYASTSESAESAACCEIVVAFDVVCDWSAAIERASTAGPIDQPMRQPGIAIDFANPSTTTSRPDAGATDNNDAASPS